MFPAVTVCDGPVAIRVVMKRSDIRYTHCFIREKDVTWPLGICSPLQAK